jgi:hypothetical protein
MANGPSSRVASVAGATLAAYGRKICGIGIRLTNLDAGTACKLRPPRSTTAVTWSKSLAGDRGILSRAAQDHVPPRELRPDRHVSLLHSRVSTDFEAAVLSSWSAQ